MKILVTGGLGYIGSVTTKYLLEAGHRVVILDDLSTGNLDTLPKGVQFIKGDIGNISKLIRSSDNIDLVIHLAGVLIVGESVVNPEKYWEINVGGSFEVIRTMRKLGIKKLIFSSSSAIYGKRIKIPIEEDSIAEPTSTYGMTKLAVEMIITSECLAYGLAATSLRLFNVVGSYKGLGQRRSSNNPFIPRVLETVLGKEPIFYLFGDNYMTKDGTTVRDYIEVADVAAAVLLAMNKLKTSKHAIYNLGNNNAFSNKELISAIEKVISKKIPLKVMPKQDCYPPILVASGDKAKDQLGWTPKKLKVEDMIKEALDWHKKYIS
jgi:UDP-glucose 4-epimerase